MSFGYKTAATKSSAIEILMTRFLPVIIVFSFVVNYHEVYSIILNHFIEILVFTVMSLVVPIFFSQYSVNSIGAKKSSIIAAFVFPITWIGEFIREDDISSPYIFKKYFLK